MAEIKPFKARPFLDFCEVCLDEGKCHDAGKCLFDASYAEDLNKKARVLPLDRPE